MKKFYVLLFTLFCGYFSHAQVAPITGITDVCEGATTTLSDATAGGSWSCAAIGATVDAFTGVVTGIAAGTAEVTYTVGVGVATTVVTIYPAPSAITGINFVCPGATTTLSDAVSGTWSSSNTAVATIDATTGTATGIAAGTTDITFTSTAGCIATTKVIVYPVIAPLTGIRSFCKGATTLLSDVVPGGTWSSSNTTIASVADPGIVTGLAAGTAVISYVAASTCDVATATVTVIPLPDAGIITGTTKICAGSSDTLRSTTAGGVWSTNNYGIADLNEGGVVKGMISGTATITYTYKNSCGSDTTTTMITIYPAPDKVHITIHPDTFLCSNSLFHNFGAKESVPDGVRYTWTAVNATIYAAAGQNSLVHFPTPGLATVILTASQKATSCTSRDSIRFHISEDKAPDNYITYYMPEFICSDHTADSYQWGYDDVHTLDSTLVPGMTNQNYYDPNADFGNRYYWVITNHKGCLQKAYFTTPLSTINTLSNNTIDINLYPNPANEMVNIKVGGLTRGDEMIATIFDATGRKMNAITITDNNVSMPVSELMPGAYIVQFTMNGSKIGQKVFMKR